MRWFIGLVLVGILFTPAAVAIAQKDSEAATLQMTENSKSYLLNVPVSSLLVTIPKNGLRWTAPSLGPELQNPRYFQFSNKDQLLMLSGWFEPSEAFKGIKVFWEEESANLKRQRLPDPEDVSFVEDGKWNVIFYDQRLEGIRSSHLRAEWVEAETWIDVHISVTGTRSLAEQRAKLREVLDTIQVTQKPLDIPIETSGEDTPREYAVPGHGKLILRVPKTWKDFTKPLQDPPSVLLRFKPPSGDTFYVQVTAVWFDPQKHTNDTPEFLRAKVRQTSVDLLNSSVEKEAKLQEMRGEETLGYYYSLTDRNPPPEEYKYMTQGISVTGEIRILFTILQRVDSAADRTAALQMLANATYSK